MSAQRSPSLGVDLDTIAGPHPYPLFAHLRSAAPVTWVPELDGWLVTGHAAATQVLRDAATFTVDDPRFSTLRLTGPSMLATDGAEHSRHRGAFAADYRPAGLRGEIEEFTRATAERLVAERRQPDRVEVRAELAEPLALEVLDRFLQLGTPVERVAGWYRGLAVGFETDDGRRGRLDVVDDLSRVAAGLSGHRHRGLALDELTGNLAITLLGGVETVEGTICQAVRCRFGLPDRDFRNVADRQVIEESMRLEPSAARLDRYATADIEVGGAEIAVGDLVLVSITAANRDPAVFEQPDQFDPERENLGKQLGFGIGPHYCLGVHLARLEAREALRAIEQALPGASVDDADSDPTSGLIFRKPRRLTVEARP